MSSNEPISPLDAMSAAVHAASKLTHDSEKSEELTPEMLASAIKLAALSTDHQEKLTPATVNAAIHVAKKSSKHHKQHENLTPESLAVALKLATKVSSNNDDDDDNKTNDTNDMSADQMLAAMKAAVVMTQQTQSNPVVTSEILSDALKLAKK